MILSDKEIKKYAQNINTPLIEPFSKIIFRRLLMMSVCLAILQY